MTLNRYSSYLNIGPYSKPGLYKLDLDRILLENPRVKIPFVKPQGLKQQIVPGEEPCLDVLNSAGNLSFQVSSLAKSKDSHQKETLVESPEPLQVEYELDSPVLFSINPDENQGLLKDSKSLAEELKDAVEQPRNLQPSPASQLMLKSLHPGLTGKRMNGCILDERICEEIEIISTMARDTVSEHTSLYGLWDNETK